jgi:hypothetical protein
VLRQPAPHFTFLGIGCVTAALAAGCGNSRTLLPDVNHPVAPSGFQALAYPASGVSLEVPSNWSVVRQRAPVVAVITSGTAVVAVWRFPRNTSPPHGTAAMNSTTTKLIAAARVRDTTLQLIRSRLVSVGDLSAVELDAFERIRGQPRRVRSTHVFVPGAEVVLEEYAPPAMFHAVDHAVFSPVRRSLRLLPAKG